MGTRVGRQGTTGGDRNLYVLMPSSPYLGWGRSFYVQGLRELSVYKGRRKRGPLSLSIPGGPRPPIKVEGSLT